MKEVIWKHNLGSMSGKKTIPIPATAEFLCVHKQHGDAVAWFKLDPTHVVDQGRAIRAELTGSYFDSSDVIRFLGTVLFDEGRFVLHYFEVKP